MSVPPPTPSFQYTIRVEAADIDLMGHVNNTVYLHWVQEVATAHWMSLTTEEEQQTILWVVLRHEIDYKRPAMLDDEVQLRTWVGTVSGLTFERHTEISRPSDQQILAIARTLWVPVNSQTKRPQRLGAALRAKFSLSQEAAPPKVQSSSDSK